MLSTKYRPFASEAAPSLVPIILTFAPIMASLDFESTTLPVSLPTPDCAEPETVKIVTNRSPVKSSLKIFIPTPPKMLDDVICKKLCSFVVYLNGEPHFSAGFT